MEWVNVLNQQHPSSEAIQHTLRYPLELPEALHVDEALGLKQQHRLGHLDKQISVQMTTNFPLQSH